MIIYVVDGGSGSFEVFSNKKDAEKCKKELRKGLEEVGKVASDDSFAPVDARVCKYTIKTKNELMNVMNPLSGGWQQLQ
tara:strand:- start:28 stop:264 length:237 start_codon:yes stop_codon:yes gene_type:complete